MSDPNRPTTPPGWYPEGRGQRWWDGSRWTDQVQPPPYFPATVTGGRRRPSAVLLGGAFALLAILVALVVVFTVVVEDSPEGVAEDFLDAGFDRNFDRICELYSEDRRDYYFDRAEADDCDEYVDWAEGEFDDFGDALDEAYGITVEEYYDAIDHEVEITDVDEESDDLVVVEYEETFAYTGDDEDIIDRQFGGETTDVDNGVIRLVREGGEWKVDSQVNDGDDPSAVAEEYLKLSFAGDYERLCLLSVEAILLESGADDCNEYADQREEELDGFDSDFEAEYGASYDELRDDIDFEVEAEDAEEDEDEARVDWETTWSYEGENAEFVEDVLGGDETSTDSGTMLLCREDGSWKVQVQYDDTVSSDRCGGN